MAALHLTRLVIVRRLGRFLSTGILAALLPHPVWAGGSGFEAAFLPWQSLTFEARRLFARGEFTVALSPLPDWRANNPLWSVKDRDALQPCAGLLQLDAQGELLSNRAQMRLWLDPVDFHMYQRSRLTVGNERRLKAARFLPDGVLWTRREPENGRTQGDPLQWPVSRQKAIPYPPAGETAHWLDPVSLLMLVSAAGLSQAGEQLSVPIFTDQQPYRVILKVEAAQSLEIDYRLQATGSQRQEKGRREVLRVSVAYAPLLESDDEPEFNLLGLTGEISIYLDPVSGIPVQLEGDAESQGRQVIRLTKVELADGELWQKLASPVVAEEAALAQKSLDSCDRPLSILGR